MAQIDRRRSVRTQLPRTLARFGLIILTIMVAGSYYTYTQIRDKMRTMEQSAVVALTEGTVAGLSDMIVVRDYGHLQTTLQQTLHNAAIRSIAVTDLSGRVLSAVARTDRGIEPVFPDAPLPVEVEPGQPGSVTRTGNQIVVWQRIDNTFHVGWLRVELTTDPYDSVVNSLFANLALTIGGMITAMLIVGTVQFNTAYRHMHTYETELLDAVHRDPLTGLANKLALEQYVKESMAYALLNTTNFALCFVDLDGFKGVNDRLGHTTGDQVLQQVAARFQYMLRSTDRIVRVGGDEFVVILNDIPSDQVSPLLERLRRRLSEPYEVSGHTVRDISASIGVAEYPSTNTTPQALIEAADQAMYRAKTSGGDQIAHWKHSV